MWLESKIPKNEATVTLHSAAYKMNVLKVPWGNKHPTQHQDETVQCGQMSIIPKPELGEFWEGIPFLNFPSAGWSL